MAERGEVTRVSAKEQATTRTTSTLIPWSSNKRQAFRVLLSLRQWSTTFAMAGTIDDLDLPSTFKPWLYEHFVMSKLAWPFTSLDLSLTFVQQLEAVTTCFLKQWSGLPRPANTAILHLGSSNRADLHLKQFTTFWKQMQIVRLDILKSSSDPVVLGFMIVFSLTRVSGHADILLQWSMPVLPR